MTDHFGSSREIEIELNHEARKEVFRKVAGTAIENSHAALKQVWVALFAGGTFQLIRSFDNFMGCVRATPAEIERAGKSLKDVCEIAYLQGYLVNIPPQSINNPVPWSEIGLLLTLYLIYVLTFYRFYVGNIRVFDVRYIEIGKFVALLAEKLEAAAKKLGEASESKNNGPAQKANAQKDQLYQQFFDYNNKQKRIGDSIFLMVKTLTIVGLTLEINNPFFFIVIYTVVLLLDLGWMQASNYLDKWFGQKPSIVAGQKSVEANRLEELLSGNPFFVYKYFAWLGLTRALDNEATAPGKLLSGDRFYEYVDRLGLTRRRRDDAIQCKELERRRIERKLVKVFPSRAIRFWTRINASCVACLVVVLLGLIRFPPLQFPTLAIDFGLSQFQLFAIAEAVMLANCLADLIATWGFYNPLFQLAHDLVVADKDPDVSSAERTACSG